MESLYKETRELLKNQLLDFINDEIDTTKVQKKKSIESCDINYFSGALDELGIIKEYIKSL